MSGLTAKGLVTSLHGSFLTMYSEPPSLSRTLDLKIPINPGPPQHGSLEAPKPCPAHLHQCCAQSKDAHGQQVLLEPGLHGLIAGLQETRISQGLLAHPDPPCRPQEVRFTLTAFHQVPGACSPQLSLNSRQQESGTRVVLYTSNQSV